MDTADKVETKPEVAMPEPADWESRKAVTDKLIFNHTLGAMGIGLIHVPLITMTALTALQVRLLYKLSHLYNQDFSQDAAKKIIGALLGSVVPLFATAPLSSLFKLVPIVGPVVSAFIMPATGGASTYALGKVFIQHFESGGTFLTFDPSSVKSHFAELFEEGKTFTNSLKKSPRKAQAVSV
jgi:uncharacterized protein (DUF697 family)